MLWTNGGTAHEVDTGASLGLSLHRTSGDVHARTIKMCYTFPSACHWQCHVCDMTKGGVAFDT